MLGYLIPLIEEDIYTVKKASYFSLAGMSQTKLSMAGNNFFYSVDANANVARVSEIYQNHQNVRCVLAY